MNSPKFDTPRSKHVTLSRSIWVKGKGMPKDGLEIGPAGLDVVVMTDNGSDWYIPWMHYDRSARKHVQIKVATILSTL